MLLLVLLVRMKSIVILSFLFPKSEQVTGRLGATPGTHTHENSAAAREQAARPC